MRLDVTRARGHSKEWCGDKGVIVPVDKDHTVIVVVVVCTSRISTVVVIVVDSTSTEPFRVVLVDGGMQYLYDRHK